MDRPQYTNAFSITLNPALGEVVITFIHEYPVMGTPDETATPGCPQQVKTTTGRDKVSSIVFPSGLAHQLLEALTETLSGSESNL